METKIPGFEYRRVRCNDTEINVASAGAGAPVLLMHGFPETHLAWRAVAPALTRQHRVICPDLPGYGASGKPDDGPERYAKRVLATDLRALMAKLGHDRFAAVGHDRGGLIAFRLALDHPDAVTHVAVMDILPAADMWRSLQGVAGVFAFHLFLLAQPNDLPERMIAADPETFFGHFLDVWVKRPGAIPPETRRAYLDACADPAAIHAICNDYRASAFIDPRHDEADRQAGKRLAMPALALWQDPGDQPLPFDPRAIWSSWAPRLQTRALPGGHFLPEECPEEVVAALAQLLATRS